MKLPTVQLAWRQALRTAARFPLPLLAGVTGSAALLARNHIAPGNLEAREAALRLALPAWLGVALLFSLVILAERQRLKWYWAWSLQAAGVGLLATYYHYLLQDPYPVRMARFCLFLLAAHLCAMLANEGLHSSMASFWQHNQRMFARLALALAHSLVLFLGTAFALAALKSLFGLDLPDRFFLDPGIAILGVFATWFFLAGVPRAESAEEPGRPYSRGLRILALFILMPLVCLYLIILYAYAIKVLVQLEWPIGWVSSLILGLACAGIITLLLLHPILENEANALIQSAARHFYHSLFPLLLLLFVAIGRRVVDYGLTERRYFVLALAMWLAGIALYFTLDRRRDIRVIPASLCLVSLLAAFGPWGAFEVSRKSQLIRLEGMLKSHGMLVEGKLAKSPGRVPRRVNEEISGIAYYLEDRGRLEDLRAWIPALDDSGQSQFTIWHLALENKFAFLEALELPYLTPGQRLVGAAEAVSFHCRSCAGPVLKVSGYDYVILDYQAGVEESDTTSPPGVLTAGTGPAPVAASAPPAAAAGVGSAAPRADAPPGGGAPPEGGGVPKAEGAPMLGFRREIPDAEGLSFAFDSHSGLLSFARRGSEGLQVDVGAYFQKLRERYPDAYDLNLPEQEMAVVREDKALKVLLRLRSLKGEAAESEGQGTVKLREFSGDVLIRCKDLPRPRGARR